MQSAPWSNTYFWILAGKYGQDFAQNMKIINPTWRRSQHHKNILSIQEVKNCHQKSWRFFIWTKWALKQNFMRFYGVLCSAHLQQPVKKHFARLKNMFYWNWGNFVIEFLFCTAEYEKYCGNKLFAFLILNIIGEISENLGRKLNIERKQQK